MWGQLCVRIHVVDSSSKSIRDKVGDQCQKICAFPRYTKRRLRIKEPLFFMLSRCWLQIDRHVTYARACNENANWDNLILIRNGRALYSFPIPDTTNKIISMMHVNSQAILNARQDPHVSNVAQSNPDSLINLPPARDTDRWNLCYYHHH
jgi:hypothetical protein